MAKTKKAPVRKRKAAPKKSVAKQPASKKQKLVAKVKPSRSPLAGLASSARFARAYMIGALAGLFGSTLFWSGMSARLQQANADQLVNAYLFESLKTFHAASLPIQHSFLIKWPVFWLIKVLGSGGFAYISMTMLLSVLSVGALALVIYRLERRPLIFGTICLALASCLLLVPAQPYAGGLLPVNLAMIATRNIEYVFYLACLVALIKWPQVKSWGFWLAMLGLSLLIASDQLFLTLSLGGALLALVAYVFTKRWHVAELVIKWLIGSLIASAGSVIIIWLINASHLTHVAGQAASGGPYGLVHHLSGLALGMTYGVLGLLTNFGANPGYSASTLRGWPHAALTNLASPAALTYLVNGVVVAAGGFVVIKWLVDSLRQHKAGALVLNIRNKLSLLLIWTSLAALAAFVVTDHYYLVDARYLTIALFAVFVAAASYSSQKRWPAEKVLIAGLVLAFSLALGFFGAMNNYQTQANALKNINDRNSLVAQALNHHQVDTLVGDYWRVIPTKQASKGRLDVTPLTNCLIPRNILSSQQWQPDLAKHSFAYLLSLDKALTDYPTCSLAQVVDAYGRPNASAVVAGTIENPQEVLLFYDKGANLSAPAINATNKPPATVVPISLDELPNTNCTGLTVMNVVAHEDDDLLFMNPDLLHDIKEGHCVRTVYVTAGDAGGDQFYWLAREQGSEAAYSTMLSSDAVWVQRVVKLDDKQFVTVANPRGNSQISLVFMHLPDGNLKGQGFAAEHHESLVHLEQGQVKQIHSVTGQSVFTGDQLVGALASLMRIYRPGEIHTQANYTDRAYPDHSDHTAVGRFAQKAYARYEQQQYDGRVTIPIKFYLGYPEHGRPQNIFGAELDAIEKVFLAYAQFDGSVCRTHAECAKWPTISSYLSRQYQNAY